MAKKLYEEASVQAIANAIRAKNGEMTTYKIGDMAAAIAAISGSPIVDDGLENTVQYRQMNATAAAFLANVDYTENANDYSVTKVTPYYSATTAYSKEEPDGLKVKVPADTTIAVAQVNIRCNAEPVYNRCLVGICDATKMAASEYLPVFHAATGTSPAAEIADVPHAGRVDHTHTALGHKLVGFPAKSECTGLQRLHVVDHASSGNRVASGLTALCNRECGVGRNFDLQPIRLLLAVRCRR